VPASEKGSVTATTSTATWPNQPAVDRSDTSRGPVRLRDVRKTTRATPEQVAAGEPRIPSVAAAVKRSCRYVPWSNAASEEGSQPKSAATS
jgi:hypothetical protein